MKRKSKNQRRSSVPSKRPVRRDCRNCAHYFQHQPRENDGLSKYVYEYCGMGRGGQGSKHRMTSKDCPHYTPNKPGERPETRSEKP